MGREQDYRNASKYLYVPLYDEDIQKQIREKNQEISSISDPRYQLEAFSRPGAPRPPVAREIPPPISPILAPKVSREQARENIAAFNRGIEAMPKVVRNYVSETSPREMMSDGSNLLRDTAKSIRDDPGGAVLDALPIVSTYRAYEESDRLNKAAADARKAGDFDTAEKLEALSAYNTSVGTLGVLPVLGLLRRVNRAIPAGEYEVPARFLKDPQPDPATVQRALDRGFNQKQANYLGLPYKGQGSHFISQAWLREKGVPEIIIHSPFNLIKGRDMSIGDFYDFHYKVDRSFNGTALPARSEVGGGRWSGNTIGLEKYGPAGRLWHRSPTPFKMAVATPVAIGGRLYWANDEEE